ncbi:MAG: ABC transporter permease [Chloroflexi bacterium]|nr:ABC transporter permease [Chloroflexota bacterium]
MRTYIIRRVLLTIPVLFAITFINFTLIHLAPGDPLIFLMMQTDQTGGMTNRQVLEANNNLYGDFMDKRRHELGLDLPIPVQYVNWLGQLSHGDFGRSMIDGSRIFPEMMLRLKVTLQLTMISLIFSIIIGITLGTLSAIYQYTWFDSLVSLVSYLFMSVPGFFLALVGINIFALKLKLLPIGRVYDAATGGTLDDRLFHLILPVLVIGLSSSVGLLRYTRTSVLEVMREDYVNVARAKGLPERVIRFRHILRNALVPVVTIIGHELPGVFGGSALYETVFLWPGLGQWAAKAAASHDFAIMMVVITVTATLIVFTNLFVDIIYAVIDPRISYS